MARLAGAAVANPYLCRNTPRDRLGRSAMKDYLVIYEQADDGGGVPTPRACTRPTLDRP
jgi:hypothetical protein